MLHKKELEVLNIIASKDGEPVTSSEISRNYNKLSQSTVQAVLRNLLKNKIVRVVGKIHYNNEKVACREFIITDKAKNEVKDQAVDFLNSIDSIISVEEIVEEYNRRKKDWELSLCTHKDFKGNSTLTFDTASNEVFCTKCGKVFKRCV